MPPRGVDPGGEKTLAMRHLSSYNIRGLMFPSVLGIRMGVFQLWVCLTVLTEQDILFNDCIWNGNGETTPQPPTSCGIHKN